MRITEALKILQQAPEGATPYDVILACGFTPIHLKTFLAAHLQQALSSRKVSVSAGLYGDPAGTLEAAAAQAPHAVVLPLEWPDLDPRLGFRSSGRSGPSQMPDILTGANSMLDRLAVAIENAPAGIPIAVSLPTLPLPPVFHTPGWQCAEAELVMTRQLQEFALRISRRSGCSLISAARLAETSPAIDRFDLKSDLLTGLPYTIAHADALASLLALLLAPPAPKKGLITDLDDTLWCGLAGEIGPDQVSWDLASHNQLHGLYQRLLSSLAEAGVLVAAASKNDRAVVDQVFKRKDLLLSPEQVFPFEVHWEAKSTSVDRILRAWNIDAASVVFVDDSPIELAEVSAAHPGIETVLFPRNDHRAACSMFSRLRDLFGKPRISSEDALRLESLRRGAEFLSVSQTGRADAFLRNAEAVIAFEFDAASDPRVLELVNKTNQFNLNGVRYTEADWRNRLTGPNALLAAVSYEDKFGRLGIISVIQGSRQDDVLQIAVWVMSCRAFSRRIEHQCLRMLFERYRASEIVFDFAPTAKNGPLRDFFASFSGAPPEAPFRLTKEAFEKSCPPLYHRVLASEAQVQANA